MRILWYSLGRWFAPSRAGVEVVDLWSTNDDALTQLTSEPYVLFLEPTPYPGYNYDPVRMAKRLDAVASRKPVRLVAFVSHPTPIPFETQCAFATQIGRVLGVTPELQRVGVATRSSTRLSGAKKEGRSDEPVDPGPAVDWPRVLDAALAESGAESLPDGTDRLVSFYVYPSRTQKFSPTERRLLALAAAGQVSVIADQLQDALNVELVTARRAIRRIATEFCQDDGRRSPELVAQLVTRYSWFLRYNEH